MKQVTTFQELKTAINLNGEMVVSKDSENNVIIMSMEEYYKNIMRKDIIENLKKSEEEIENGEGIKAECAFGELRQKYGY